MFSQLFAAKPDLAALPFYDGAFFPVLDIGQGFVLVLQQVEVGDPVPGVGLLDIMPDGLVCQLPPEVHLGKSGAIPCVRLSMPMDRQG